MYFHGFFQTDVLINFFIPLRRAEAITWENFFPAKRDPGSHRGKSNFLGQFLTMFNSINPFHATSIFLYPL